MAYDHELAIKLMIWHHLLKKTTNIQSMFCTHTKVLTSITHRRNAHINHNMNSSSILRFLPTLGSSANVFFATLCRLVLILSSALLSISLFRSTTYTVWPVWAATWRTYYTQNVSRKEKFTGWHNLWIQRTSGSVIAIMANLRYNFMGNHTTIYDHTHSSRGSWKIKHNFQVIEA